ncbi:hypothetical protein [Streptomyces sp. NPDC050263]|uniref:hypothetical protein n=1 Tax=Streptomyces sp. NPDC050263 TaxID=3155037 RepID=UPI00344815F6
MTWLNGFRLVLGTTEIDARRFGRALLTAVVLLCVGERGKSLARRSRQAVRSGAAGRSAAAEWSGEAG